MAKLFELRPKKDLMDPTFEGYKLSLDALPVYKHDLPAVVQHRNPNSDQYSYQFVKLFSLHNHLLNDPWNVDFVYFVTEDMQVFCTHLHSLVSQSPDFKSVWKMPMEHGNVKGYFNASLSFASPNLAVSTDGGGVFYIINTNQRSTSAHNQWEVKYSDSLFGSGKPFKILHSFLNETESGEILDLSVLLIRVQAIDEVESQIALSTLACDEKETPFVTCLEFLNFHFINNQWSVNQLKRIAVPHGVDYASILSPGKSLCVVAREPLGIIFDSLKSVATPKPDGNGIITDSPSKEEAKYTWAENEDEVIIWMSFDKHTSKHDLVIEFKLQFLKVVYKKETVLEGELAHSISCESSLWTLSEGKLEIILPKVDKNLNWDHLIVSDSRGLKVLDAEAAAEWHQRLIHMTSIEMEPGAQENRQPMLTNEDLEECDDVSVEEINLYRFNGETNELTDKGMLGGHQLLFTLPLAPNMAPGFCLRHDVDGLVWQPMGDELEGSWGCQHIATLQALGYIQASKEQRKFTLSPPNMSYAAICDAFHHIFLYRQPGGASNGVEMVYRPTGRKVGTVARQQVLNLDSREECLGALATDTFLLVLTSSSLFAIRINSD